jgi:4-aminobutyrate aminotransferase-like enzyme
VRIIPPLVTVEDEIDEAIATIRAALDAIGS